MKEVNAANNIDTLTANDHDLLAVALGAPARQVILRAEEIGRQTGWRDGFLTVECGFVPEDPEQYVSALANSPGRCWSDLCERMPGTVSRGRVREAVHALPLVEGTEDVIPDSALWGACVALGLLCSIYRYEENHDGHEGVSMNSKPKRRVVDLGDDAVEELKGIPITLALPYSQVSKRLGRAVPHLSFPDQSSYNIKIRDPKSNHPYLHRFDNTDLRWYVSDPRFSRQYPLSTVNQCFADIDHAGLCLATGQR